MIHNKELDAGAPAINPFSSKACPTADEGAENLRLDCSKLKCTFGI